MSPEAIQRELVLYVQQRTGAQRAEPLAFSRLSGGAIQSNYALSVECLGGSRPGRLDLVVRSDSPSKVDASLTREQEFQVLRVARQAGVTVPEPLWLCTDTSVIGNVFCIMARVPGMAEGRKLVRAQLEDRQVKNITEQLGRELARLHTVCPPDARLDFLPVPAGSPALWRVQAYRDALDRIPEPHPVLEWSLNWLQDNAPESAGIVLCHCDFRTGNYMVDQGRVSGILDWEFAAWSDPYEDLGWLCAKSWRFGVNDKAVGGIGHKTDLFAAYGQASGRPVDGNAVLYWEAMGMTRWAIIALQQAQRHISGGQASLELALTGRLVPEIEFDLLEHIQHHGGSA
ncbi:phosphotransferase family protein [Pollutimonas sp. H1-120]|uniref:phosphotransferase family protein n=1 Tax=Pollutimonas sp. H1-120 TaxID=3148824 RepID=UPI003B5228B3